MFMQICTCDYCKNSENLKVQLTVEFEREQCDKCGNFDISKWDFLFCNIDCLTKWQAQNKGKIPCKFCWGTGHPSGYKENGTCHLCGGKGTLEI